VNISRKSPGRWRRGAIALFALLACSGATLALSAPAFAAPATHADFSFRPKSPSTGDTVTFTSNSDAADGTTIVSYRWDLDADGSYETDMGSSDAPVTARYASAGSYEVGLEITDSAGTMDPKTHHVTVAGRPPSASFTVVPSAPSVGQPVLFVSTASDPDGRIVNQVWDLNGDGNFDNGGGRTALRSFPTPGAYVVGLRVTDNDGQVAFYSQTILISGALGATSTPAGGGRSFRLLSPFPLVRIAGQIARHGTRIRLLTVQAPAGARVSIRCRGRGCPFEKQVRTAARAPQAHAARVVRVRRLERVLRAGVMVQIFVTKQDTIGKYTRFKMRRGKAPSRADRCLDPSSSRPIACPGA
jgi:PKD repeat protein